MLSKKILKCYTMASILFIYADFSGNEGVVLGPFFLGLLSSIGAH